LKLIAIFCWLSNNDSSSFSIFAFCWSICFWHCSETIFAISFCCCWYSFI
jgi:hypothetical protein